MIPRLTARRVGRPRPRRPRGGAATFHDARDFHPRPQPRRRACARSLGHRPHGGLLQHLPPWTAPHRAGGMDGGRRPRPRGRIAGSHSTGAGGVLRRDAQDVRRPTGPARHGISAARMGCPARHPVRDDAELQRAGAPAGRLARHPRRGCRQRQEPHPHHRPVPSRRRRQRRTHRVRWRPRSQALAARARRSAHARYFFVTVIVTRKWLLPVGLIVLLVVGVAVLWHTGVLHRISNKDHLIALLREGGPTGALWCIAVQFLQVVIAAIPGEITSDRKSTRLNSSHVSISYAVFCLKKKKKYHKAATPSFPNQTP